MLRYDTLCYVTLRYVISCYTVLYYVTLYYIILYYIILYYIILYYIILSMGLGSLVSKRWTVKLALCRRAEQTRWATALTLFAEDLVFRQVVVVVFLQVICFLGRQGAGFWDGNRWQQRGWAQGVISMVPGLLLEAKTGHKTIIVAKLMYGHLCWYLC